MHIGTWLEPGASWNQTADLIVVCCCAVQLLHKLSYGMLLAKQLKKSGQHISLNKSWVPIQPNPAYHASARYTDTQVTPNGLVIVLCHAIAFEISQGNQIDRWKMAFVCPTAKGGHMFLQPWLCLSSFPIKSFYHLLRVPSFSPQAISSSQATCEKNAQHMVWTYIFCSPKNVRRQGSAHTNKALQSNASEQLSNCAQLETFTHIQE